MKRLIRRPIKAGEDMVEKMARALEEYYGVSREAIDLVAQINGWTEDTMKDILYVVEAERDFPEDILKQM